MARWTTKETMRGKPVVTATVELRVAGAFGETVEPEAVSYLEERLAEAVAGLTAVMLVRTAMGAAFHGQIRMGLLNEALTVSCETDSVEDSAPRAQALYAEVMAKSKIAQTKN